MQMQASYQSPLMVAPQSIAEQQHYFQQALFEQKLQEQANVISDLKMRLVEQ